MLELHGISRRAFDLIVAEEVTSQVRYNARYRHPEWPGFSSGVTCGIGYDFGQNTRAQIVADWSGKIPAAMVTALAKTAGVTGQAAQPLARGLRDVVDIPWEVALDVFSNTSLPRYLALMRRSLPGAELLSPDCQGVLGSLVFNRGASFGKSGPRYAEMREIKACVKSGQLQRIPALLRSMARLWPKTSGVYSRRFKEATLFEQGLAAHHAEHFAAVAEVEPLPDPDLVAQVQQRLRDLGYFDAGAVDGSLTPKGRAEAAILAFRHEHDLPLVPSIDDELVAELARATPRQVAEARATATIEDLRAQGSETVSLTDKVKGWGGKIFGAASGTAGAGTLAVITDQVTAVSSAKQAVGGLGLTTQSLVIIGAIVAVLALCAGAGLLIWHIANKVEQKRLGDYRIGKNT